MAQGQTAVQLIKTINSLGKDSRMDLEPEAWPPLQLN